MGLGNMCYLGTGSLTLARIESWCASQHLLDDQPNLTLKFFHNPTTSVLVYNLHTASLDLAFLYGNYAKINISCLRCRYNLIQA